MAFGAAEVPATASNLKDAQAKFYEPYYWRSTSRVTVDLEVHPRPPRCASGLHDIHGLECRGLQRGAAHVLFAGEERHTSMAGSSMTQDLTTARQRTRKRSVRATSARPLATTWTPKVCKIMAFWAAFSGFGP